MKPRYRLLSALMLGLLLVSAAAQAQVHGIPASVTSVRTGGNIFIDPLGIPASVTSLGPLGYTTDTTIVNMPVPQRDRRGRSRTGIPVSVPVLVPMPFYVGQPVVIERVIEADDAEVKPQKIIVEIHEVKDLPNNQSTAEPVESLKPQPPQQEVADNRIPTIFIFLDGRRKEFRDFAIMNNELIDLAGGRTRHYLLKDLDRQATLKANTDNGVDLRLPQS